MVFALMTALTFIAGGALAVDKVTVEPWFVEKMVDNEAVLAPGTTTYCNKDFEVENMGEDMAEVHIIRGSGDNYDMDRIPSGGKLAYKLQDRSIFATDASEGNWVDEARIVNSTMGSSRLKIYCK
jgi:hypothetical protein